jgi:hypothetical protein
MYRYPRAVLNNEDEVRLRATVGLPTTAHGQIIVF